MLEGGAISFISFTHSFFSNIYKNIFRNNSAEGGGCFDTNLYVGGVLEFRQNLYFHNIGYSILGIGSGNVHKILGSLITYTLVTSINCFYINNYSQVKGIKN